MHQKDYCEDGNIDRLQHLFGRKWKRILKFTCNRNCTKQEKDLEKDEVVKMIVLFSKHTVNYDNQVTVVQHMQRFICQKNPNSLNKFAKSIQN